MRTILEISIAIDKNKRASLYLKNTDIEEPNKNIYVTKMEEIRNKLSMDQYKRIFNFEMARLRELSNEYNFKWLEYIYIEDVNNNKYEYVGGYIKLCNLSYVPVGYVDICKNNVFSSLRIIIKKLEKYRKNIGSVRNKNVLFLDPLSSAIFLHEAIGHTSEIDIKQRFKILKKPKIKNAVVTNGPFPWEKLDDMGNRSEKTILNYADISRESGMYRVFQSKKNKNLNIRMIMQRSLEMHTKKNLMKKNINFIIISGKLVPRDKLVIIEGYSKTSEKIELRIPLNDISEIKSIGREMISSSICNKIGYPSIIRFVTGETKIQLKKDIERYRA